MEQDWIRMTIDPVSAVFYRLRQLRFTRDPSAITSVISERTEMAELLRLILDYCSSSQSHGPDLKVERNERNHYVTWIPCNFLRVIYYGTWAILIQCIRVMVVGWQSNRGNTKDSLFVINIVKRQLLGNSYACFRKVFSLKILMIMVKCCFCKRLNTYFYHTHLWIYTYFRHVYN